MKNLIDIYETLYHGILDGDFDNRLKDDDINIKKIINSYKERFIKIVSLASDMTDSDIVLLRDTITNMEGMYDDKFMLCYIPSTLRDMLIKSSDKKLTKADFNGFASDKKNYDFSVSIELMYLERADSEVTNSLKQFKNLSKGKWHPLRGNASVAILGNSIVFKKDTLLYFYINDTYRLPFRLVNSHSNKHSRPLY